MANAIIYGPSGAGKTVNSTMVRTGKRGRNLLLNSDNSHVVLKNFKRDNLDVEVVGKWMDKDNTGKPQDNFIKQFERAVAADKYDNIIVDNVSDIFDMAILEMEASGKYKDMRQAYQQVYMQLKRLAREAGRVNTNVIFTAWHNQEPIVLPDGTQQMRVSPKLPMKILDNFIGLCNVCAYLTKAEKDGQQIYYYVTGGSPTLYAKDQLYCRASCMPEDIFTEPKKQENKQ